MQKTRRNRVIQALIIAFMLVTQGMHAWGDGTNGSGRVGSLKDSDPPQPVLKSSVVPPLPYDDNGLPQSLQNSARSSGTNAENNLHNQELMRALDAGNMGASSIHAPGGPTDDKPTNTLQATTPSPSKDSSVVKNLKSMDPSLTNLHRTVVPPLPPSDNQPPQAPTVQSNVDRKLWIQNVLLKIDRMRNEAEAQIKKADASILAGQNLLTQAQAKGNAKVEVAVRQTIAKAQEVKKKNELNKAKAEEAIARVRNLLAKMSDEKIPVQAVVSHVSGIVFLKDKNGKFASLNNNRTYLEPGDTIQTLPKSRAEFQMLEGAATVTMGPQTTLHVTGDGLERETMEVIAGSAVIIKNKVIQNLSMTNQFDVRLHSAVISVKGTEFLVNVAPDQTSEILLIEGRLEVKALNGTNSVLLEAGQRLRLPATGRFPEPVPVDLKNLDRWWENN